MKKHLFTLSLMLFGLALPVAEALAAPTYKLVHTTNPETGEVWWSCERGDSSCEIPE